ncbi:MAG: putative zinc-binding metallopeptidase [Verrucomicrobia bacterium]|nr:putative zinc-binding metallopeptidase [Verrucomicrobiota bacterium]
MMNDLSDNTAGITVPTPPSWDQGDDAALLALRICDLPVRIEGSVLEARIARLYEELSARGLRFRPPCYLATEWLCPDGIPAIGIPFCLAHPRLQRLERAMMLEVEGEHEAECMQLLRHEAGHALNYAYRLSQRTRWRELFGRMTAPYSPHEYLTRPYSRQYVVHLRDYYAQAHPDEDFAETFAVWLTPGLDWRTRYKEWGAFRKLEYVDHLMRGLANRPPVVAGGPRHFAALRTRATLQTYYERKRREFAKAYTGFYDPVLRDLFAAENPGGLERADRFLTRHRRHLVNNIAYWGRVPKFAVDQLLRRLSRRAGELGLFLRPHDRDPLFTLGICMTALVLEARARSPEIFRRERPA